MGLRLSSQYICCQDFEDSAEMIGRAKFVYDQIRERNPEFKLPEAKAWRDKKPDQYQAVQLPNGSKFLPLTGRDPDTFRQKGAGGVRLEEAAMFVHFGACVSRAGAMVQGPAGKIQGHLHVVSTTRGENTDWIEFKRGTKGES